MTIYCLAVATTACNALPSRILKLPYPRTHVLSRQSHVLTRRSHVVSEQERGSGGPGGSDRDLGCTPHGVAALCSYPVPATQMGCPRFESSPLGQTWLGSFDWCQLPVKTLVQAWSNLVNHFLMPVKGWSTLGRVLTTAGHLWYHRQVASAGEYRFAWQRRPFHQQCTANAAERVLLRAELLM